MKFLHNIPFTTLLLGLLIGGALGATLGYFGQCTSGICPLTSTWWRGMLYGGFLGVLFALSSSGKTSARTSVSQTPAATADAARPDAPNSRNP